MISHLSRGEFPRRLMKSFTNCLKCSWLGKLDSSRTRSRLVVRLQMSRHRVSSMQVCRVSSTPPNVAPTASRSRRVAASPCCFDCRHWCSLLTSTPASFLWRATRCCKACNQRDRTPSSSYRLLVLLQSPPPVLSTGKHVDEPLQ